MKKAGAWIDPAGALALPLTAVLLFFAIACGESTGICVEVFEFEGTVELQDFTRSECEEHCATIGRALQCFFEPSVAGPTGVTAREQVFPREG